MTRKNRNLIKHIQQLAPLGQVLTSEWLKKNGCSGKLAWWYVKSGWLEKLANKAYKKAGEHVEWLGAVAAVQSQLNLPIHVAGKTALELLGMAHFLPIGGIKRVTLFCKPSRSIPKWLTSKELWSVHFEVHKTNLFNADVDNSLVTRKFDNVPLVLSSPERAMLEVCYQVPDKQSYSEANLLMENLSNLRYKLVQDLLEKCTSIKCKRVFLHLAKKNNHRWFSKLNIKKITLGSGVRQIGEKGGCYDAEYKLYVPKIKNEGYNNDKE